MSRMTLFSRPRRAFWADLRFVIGLVLIAASITGVWVVVSSAGTTTSVFQTTRTIVQGEVLTADDLRTVEVNLAVLADDYLSPATLREGVVAARTLGAGELVPRSSLADAEARRTTTIVVSSSTGVPQEVGAGSVVELWETPAPPEDAEAIAPPRVLVGDAIVHALVEDDGVLSGGPTGVELVIDRGAVTDVLAAIAAGADLSIVPVGSAR
ncbi:SAF domain-containing protein [Microbacterium sp. NPDC089696]|uniref:SAF domain-containing protein n=1 Tax=Microbacterium sp. NPDC089696 TaxID=3364199 RepID=UPI0037F4287E